MVDDIKFERVSCNLCGSEEFEPYLERGDLFTLLPGLFKVVRCRNCGLVYQNPRPSPASFYLIYPPEYVAYTPGLEKEKVVRRLDRQYGLQKRVNFILKYKKEGRLCDIGCATGDFIAQMAKQPGWDVCGVEPNAQVADYARSLGLHIITGSIDELDSTAETFDVVTLWNVIEHLYDPKAALSKIFQLLKPGGILILNTPNLSSLDARLFGPNWVGFELPRHFYVYSKVLFEKLLVSTGYTVLGSHFFYGSHAAFMSSLRFWLRAKYGRSHMRLEDLMFSLPVRIALAPFFILLEWLKLTSPMTIVCQKPLESRP